VTEVKASVARRAHGIYRGAEYVWTSAEGQDRVVVTEKMLEERRGIVKRRPGKIGDGKIFVTTVRAVVRIRTGENQRGCV